MKIKHYKQTVNLRKCTFFLINMKNKNSYKLQNKTKMLLIILAFIQPETLIRIYVSFLYKMWKCHYVRI